MNHPLLWCKPDGSWQKWAKTFVILNPPSSNKFFEASIAVITTCFYPQWIRSND